MNRFALGGDRIVVQDYYYYAISQDVVRHYLGGEAIWLLNIVRPAYLKLEAVKLDCNYSQMNYVHSNPTIPLRQDAKRSSFAIGTFCSTLDQHLYARRSTGVSPHHNPE